MRRINKDQSSFLDDSPAISGDRILRGSAQQEAFWKELRDGESHVCLEARAGTGKSSSCREGIWRLLDRDRSHRSSYVAYNTAIAKEFKDSLPKSGGARATTMHGAGFAAIRSAFPGVGKPHEYKIHDIVDAFLPRRGLATRRIKHAAVELVQQCKNHLLDGTDHGRLDGLCADSGIDVLLHRAEVYDLVPKVLARCMEVTSVVDFSDMPWLPVVLDLDFPEVDTLFVDEAQDLDECQHELVRRITGAGRLIMVGDPYQAIYSFRGADSRSMDTLSDFLAATGRGLARLPLTMTRRCPSSHVALARMIVPDFEALPDAPAGTWSDDADLESALMPGVMALCRTNAPLLSACYGLAIRGVKVAIQGKDIGESLARFVDGFEARDMPELMRRIEGYRASETDRLTALENNQGAIEKVQERCDCVLAIADRCQAPGDLSARIRKVFVNVTPESQADLVLLSSVHRAKGRESDRVAILNPELMPHVMARTDEDRQQEMNLIYVAITRSKCALDFCGPLPWPIASGDAPAEEPWPESSGPVPLPWRRVVATWSAPIREWWGRRANELQNEGHEWHEAERLAFLENGGSMEKAAKMPPTPEGDGPSPAWLDDRSLTLSLAESRDFGGPRT